MGKHKRGWRLDTGTKVAFFLVLGVLFIIVIWVALTEPEAAAKWLRWIFS